MNNVKLSGLLRILTTPKIRDEIPAVAENLPPPRLAKLDAGMAIARLSADLDGVIPHADRGNRLPRRTNPSH